jgi:predicted amidohydrolase
VITKCLVTDTVNPRFLSLPPEYHGGFLSQSDVWRYAQDPRNDLPESFVTRALATGDQCFAILQGHTLANYSWYTKVTNRFSATLRLDFDRRWVYQYRAFTLPAHRGRRLHAIGMTNALAACLERGDRGLLICVDASNKASMTSCLRMGYRVFGTIYSAAPARLLGQRGPTHGRLTRPFIYHSPGCRRFKFRLTCTDVEERVSAV